ncbi:MAG: hypothetical protein WAO77_19945, partial [Sphingobium sp.]
KYTNYTLDRERIGVSGTVEYKPSDDSRFYFRGLWSRFTEDEYRQRRPSSSGRSRATGRISGSTRPT